jgi:hypothetical protein
MREKEYEVGVCVIGGGLAGMCAAISAARRGVRVALMHDRLVLGGNASSEIRMWVCGARGENNRETGIIEEIQLENLHRNPTGNWSLWDTILYEKVRFEPNITLLLNCSCNQAEMDGTRIESVKGWQLTTETWHTVRAKFFIDCSGDSILAPLSGADFRIGREAREEFGEDIAPAQTDKKTMGMSCLLQMREMSTPQPFVAPTWANTYLSDDDLPYRDHDVSKWKTNFWWIELGGENDSIHDTEELRDELLKVALGVWDHIKNRGDHGAENWALEWLGFLPGKRESRRYVGDHILTQNDVRNEGRFDDIVAYGGWPMDDHHPAGIRYPEEPTIFHPAPSPFGIPYRCLYSHNVENLFFAGRNISTTHSALSSTRVMATCATLGQAVGTAAAIAVANDLSPRAVGQTRIRELQQTLLADDCYLPWVQRETSHIVANARLASSIGDPEPLRNGWDRPIGEAYNGWRCSSGDWVEYRFDQPTAIKEVRLVFDSDLNRKQLNLPCSYPLNAEPRQLPACLTKAFRIDVEQEDGSWQESFRTECNTQRFVHVPIEATTSAVRLTVDETWGDDQAGLFGFEIG